MSKNASVMVSSISSEESSKGVCYRDYSVVAPPDCHGSVVEPCRPSTLQTFPSKLHYLLTCGEHAGEGLKSIVSWQPHGRCFAVHNTKVFVKQVLPNWFMQSKLASFQRQLNLYGFRRFTAGPDKGGYYHELFLRGRPDLAEHIRRTKVKGEGHRKAACPETEPDFYRHFPLQEPPQLGIRANQSLASMLPPHIVAPTLLQQLPEKLSCGGGSIASNTPPAPAPALSPALPTQCNAPAPASNHDRHTDPQPNAPAPLLAAAFCPFPTNPAQVCAPSVSNPPPQPMILPQQPSLPPKVQCQGTQAQERANPSDAASFDPSPLLQQGLFESPNSLMALRPSVENERNDDVQPLMQVYHNEDIIMDALRAAAPFYPDLLRLD